MIVRMPKNKYELEILNLIKEGKEFSKMPEGEKSIIYDLATDLPKYITFDWEDINLKRYVHDIKLSYDKHKNQPGLNVICACINAIFKQYKCKIEGPMDAKTLIISDVSISKLKSRRY